MTTKAAAVIYRSDQAPCTCLSDFTAEISASGAKVGGLLQEMVSQDQGKLGGIDAIEIDSGRRIHVKAPHTAVTDPNACMLQVEALADCASALRRAISEQADLVIVEKYGKQESFGEGIVDDIVAVMVEGLPTLVAVPEIYLEQWNAHTGGEIEKLPCTPDALRNWWRDISK